MIMSDRPKNPLTFARLLMSMCSPSQTWMIPLTMITALFINIAINRITDTLVWVNPDFYDYYLVAPAGETPVEVKVETQGDAKKGNQRLMERVNQLLLDKCVNRNCAICTRCMAREQIGTLWCYSCGEPMFMQKDLPISHSQISKLTQEKSRSPTVERPSASTGSAARTEQGETQSASDDWYPHGTLLSPSATSHGLKECWHGGNLHTKRRTR